MRSVDAIECTASKVWRPTVPCHMTHWSSRQQLIRPCVKSHKIGPSVQSQCTPKTMS
jgi:hypothetical protein